MLDVFDVLDDELGCGCEPTFDDDRLVVDAPSGEGDLSAEPNCRATVVRALERRDAESVVVRTAGIERVHDGALFTAAGRFADALADREPALVERVRRDPLAGARAAMGRAGPPSRVAAETGLAECAARASGYDDALDTHAGPRISAWRVRSEPPPGARLVERRDLDTDAVARVYERDAELDTYHLTPVEATLDRDELAALVAARDRLAGIDAPLDRAAERAVRAVSPDARPELVAALRKHAGVGALADAFADPRVSDAFLPAPASGNPLYVRVDGDRLRTNVRLAPEGASALASLLRRESGRALSRADPTLDATLDVGGRRLRVAATTEPASDGYSFTFRAHDRSRWTLPDLVANGTLPPDAAALLSLAVERGAAVLLAGERGAGKTTTLAALLWELPPDIRTLVVEDTPELPVADLQDVGRDAQRLRVDQDGAAPTAAEALRTALRMGESALVVGEVRGEEAGVLYEAMRVGADGGAVLGTVHGAGADRVRERVVTDLGVPESAFADTDLVVTLSARETTAGTERRVEAIEEVLDGPTFEALYVDGEATGRIDRGNSHAVADLAGPDGTYADVCEALAARATTLDERC